MPLTGRLAVVMTGGTIGSTVRSGVAVIDAAALDAACAHAADAVGPLGVEVVLRVPFLAHSENVGPGHWVRLAELIRSMAGDVEGVLVLHGTDTAAYTAAALGYLLADLDVAVVVTGSSLPPSSPGSNADACVRGAACAAVRLPAGSYLAGASPEEEVAVWLGSRARKVRTGSPPFAGVARRPVAVVADGNMTLVHPPPETPALGAGRAGLDERVHVVGCHPGASAVGIVEWAIAQGLRGVLFDLYPGVTASTGRGDRSVEEAVRRAAAAGLVAAATACDPMIATSTRYPSTLALETAGAVLLNPLPVEAALPKLMWALAQSDSPNEVGALLRTPVRGDLLHDDLVGACAAWDSNPEPAD